MALSNRVTLATSEAMGLEVLVGGLLVGLLVFL